MEEQSIKEPDEKKKNAIFAFLWKHKIPVFFLLIIGALLLYYNLKISGIKSEQNEKLDSTIKNYEYQIDSLSILNAEQTVKVFS